MTTALDLIKSAMRKAGILTKTESPSADEAADCLASMNQMLDSWANDGLNVPYRTLESFTLSGGTYNYTMGTGGTFNTSKPIAVISSYIRDGVTDYPVKIIGDEAYAMFSDKASTGLPEYLNFTNAYPLSTVRLFPSPSSAYTLYMLTEKTIGNYSLSSTISLPTGWERAIIYQQAVEISPEYGQQVSQETASIALESMSLMRKAVVRNRPIDTPCGGGGFDIYTGYWK